MKIRRLIIGTLSVMASSLSYAGGQFLDTSITHQPNDGVPMFIHPAVIAVAKGNPKNIKSFEDLIKQPVKIVVTEGKGTYNTWITE